FCPGANQYIEDRLPDYGLFDGQKHAICLGTDSLASNLALDVMQEANLIMQNSAVFLPEELLTALTFNGAEALGLSGDFGRLHRHNNAGLNLIELNDN